MKEVLLIFLAILFSCNNTKQESIKSSNNVVYDGDFSVSTSSQLIVGKKIILEYSINEKGTNFISPDFSDFIVFGEPKTQSSFSFQEGNSSIKTAFLIEIMAKETGLYTVNPASVMVNGMKIESKEFKLNITDSEDAIESELRSLEKGEKTNLSDDFLKKVVYEFGPLEFRKEQMGWYVYTINSSYQLTKIPLDSIYKKDMSWEKRYDTYQASGNKFIISNSSKHNLSNIVSSKENQEIIYPFNVKEKYSYTENFVVTDVDLVFNKSNVNIKAILCNTYSFIVKNFKLKVTLYNDMEGKNIISTDTIVFNTSINPNEMKLFSSIYTPKIFPSSTFSTYFDCQLIGFNK